MHAFAKERPFDVAVAAVLAAIILVGAIGTLVGLNVSSLYIDEMVTAAIVDPLSGGPDGLWARALEDVHPPVYPLLAAVAAKLFGFATGARLLSALFSIATLGVLYTATRGFLERNARLFTAAAAATSGVWFVNAQNARGYALGVLFAACLAWAAFSALRQQRDGREVGWRTLGAIAALGVFGALTHYYILLLTGAVVGYFVLFSPRWGERIRFAGTGVVALAIVGGFLAYHSPHIVVDREALWFDNSFGFYKSQLVSFAANALGSGYGVAIAALLGLAGVLLVIETARSRDMALVRNEGLDLCVFAVAATLVFGVALSVFVMASFSGRNPTVTLPFIWIAFGILFQEGGRRFAGPFGYAFVAACVALTALASLRVVDRLAPSKQDWRGSARYVASLSDCDGATLPVVEHDPVWSTMPFGANYYGYYMPARAPETFLDLAPAEMTSLETGPAAWRALAEARLSGADACPVLLWTVHNMSLTQLKQVRASLEAAAPSGVTLTIRDFPYRERGALYPLVTASARKAAADQGAYVLEVAGR